MRVWVIGVLLVGAGVIASLRGLPIDGTADWLVVDAVVHGLNPHGPMSVLENRAGIPIGLTAQPRTPGALLTMMWYAVVPLEWLPFVSRFVAFVPYVLTVVLVRPKWWAFPLLLFAAQGVWYGNMSGWVTLTIAHALVRGSALGLAAATTLRLWPWFVGVVWLGDWRRLARAVGWFAALNTAGLILPGVTLAGTVDAMLGARIYIDHPTNFAVPLWAAAAVTGIFLAGWWRDRTLARYAVLPALLMSPVVWSHYLPALAVAIGKTPALKSGRS